MSRRKSSSRGDVNGIEVYLDPWTTQYGFAVSVVKITEKLGGEFAGGSMKLLVKRKQTKTLELVENLVTGKIIFSSPNYNLQIPIYIISKVFTPGILELEFICSQREDDSFVTKNLSMSFKGIEDALSYYYPKYDSNINPVSDLSDLNINQINETGREFCNKIVSGWRPNTVFGYTMEGNVVIRDVSDDARDNRCEKKVAVGKTVLFSKYPKDSWSPLMKEESINPWDPAYKETESNLTKKDYSDVAPTEITSRIYKGQYSIYSKGFISLMEASYQNARNYTSGFFSNATIKALEFPEYKLGDIIEILTTNGIVTKKDKQTEVLPEAISKKYVVGSFVIFWSGMGSEGESDGDQYRFSVTSNIFGLDQARKEDSEDKK